MILQVEQEKLEHRSMKNTKNSQVAEEETDDETEDEHDDDDDDHTGGAVFVQYSVMERERKQMIAQRRERLEKYLEDALQNGDEEEAISLQHKIAELAFLENE